MQLGHCNCTVDSSLSLPMPPLPHLLAAALAGAAIILAGGGYALCFALGRARGGVWLPLSHVAYLGLAVAVASLAWALDLRGYWRGVAALMVVGYYVGPRLIWRLSSEIEPH